MAVVTHLGVEYPCSKALKGEDYVRLLGADGAMIVAFNGVTDFTAFSITGGTWSTPTADNNCYLAVVKDDGTIGKGDHRCSDIPMKLASLPDVVVCTEMPDEYEDGKWYLIRAEV